MSDTALSALHVSHHLMPPSLKPTNHRMHPVYTYGSRSGHQIAAVERELLLGAAYGARGACSSFPFKTVSHNLAPISQSPPHSVCEEDTRKAGKVDVRLLLGKEEDDDDGDGGRSSSSSSSSSEKSPFQSDGGDPSSVVPAGRSCGGSVGDGDGMGMGMGLSPSAGGEYAAYLRRFPDVRVQGAAVRAREEPRLDGVPLRPPGREGAQEGPAQVPLLGDGVPGLPQGSCKRGDACEFAHGVFECWLHPARYRTQPCKDGTACRRRVCFFAHTPDQLRVLPPQHASPRGGGGGAAGPPGTAAAAALDSYDGSPLRHRAVEAAYLAKGLMSSSPTSTLMSPPVSPPSESPPMSPGRRRRRRRLLG
uniref:C3H1-type domain-containing protein n=1 Tax=Ananas comosus var. bracteatus TaxID=296719 RepID=A0A6V7QQ71_ANACO